MALDSNILKFAEKVVKTPIVQELGKMALNELLNLYNTGTNKIKNIKIKKLLQYDFANTLVDMATKIWTTKIRIKIIFFIKKISLYTCNLLKMEGTSNKTFVKIFAEKISDDVKKVFIGVFPL